MSGPPLLSLRDVTVGFGGAPLFSGIELHVARGERAALVGRNGSGKSTLMKTITGAVERDGGEIYAEPGLRIGWLEQEPRFAPGMTVAEYVAAGGQPEHAVDAILTEIGLDGSRELVSLSGGEGRRAGLARVFASPPDLLLLDEPTNHLDLAMIEWLEARLLAFPGALIVISHDRTFLSNVTNRVFWMDRGRLRTSERGFAHFEDWREEVLHAEEKALEKLDAKLAAEAHWLIYGITARRKRNQGRMERLEQMRAQRATLIGGRGKMKLEAKEGESKSRMVIDATAIGKSVPLAEGGERVLLKDFSTLILRGDRVGIVGPNGAGKSTLIRMLIGELPPDQGRIQVAKHLALAYFDQRRQQLDPKKTLREVLIPQGGDSVFVQGRPRHVRAYLKDFLFDPRQADSPTGTLSGGERNRLLLAKILATPADLLVLDEPTNDLDTDTLDLLEELLGDYAGTLLVVSHDRDFLDKTVSSIVFMPGDGTVTEYAGGFGDAMAQRRGAPAKPRPKPAAAGAAPETGPTRPQRQPTRLSYKDQRELDLLPERIAALENEIAALEAALADADLYARDAALAERTMRRHGEAKGELAAAEDRWLELEEQRAALDAGALKRDAVARDAGA
ncbi:MAG TPA: ATP-binding cassette domain-containing protein [Alphaproteobacteria bacterium]|jgi:ATP-binding cassette subfamily F protein uup